MDLKAIYLVVVFYTQAGQPVLLDGWFPIRTENMVQCEHQSSQTINYIKQYFSPPPNIRNVETFCKTGAELAGMESS